MIGVRGATINNKAKSRRTGKIPEWREEDFRTIVTRNADAMIVLDREGYVLFVNPAAESLFSLPSGEMVGANFGFPIVLNEQVEVYILREFKHFVAAEMRLVEVIWAGEPSYLLTFRDLTDRIMAEQALSRARDELDAKVNKRTSELTESNQQLRREITERQRAEEELKKYGVLLTNVRDIVYFVHLDGSIIEVNDAAVKAYGYSRDELKSMNIADLRIPDERAGLSDLLARCYEKGCLLQTTHQRRDGSTFPVEISSRGIELYGQRALIGIGRDITERKRDEEAMKEAKQQAELYVDLMGHDINNLNHSAMGYLELALQTLEAEKRLKLDNKVLIERPMQALANSSALINNVMKLQRLMTEGVKTRPTDLNTIFRALETMSFHSEDRDVLINIPHVPGLMVNANELLKDVFVNLITNSIKHSDSEKTLTVNVKVEPVNENDQKYYRCSVEDNGPGIMDELKSQLFNRFKRGATKAHGKGLGLYLVRTLVEGYHGRVWVEDRVHGDYGKGARFVIMLPAAEK